MDRFLVRFMFVQLLERVFRMEELLLGLESAAGPSSREIVRAFRRELEFIRSRIDLARGWLSPEDSALSPLRYKTIIKYLGSCFHSFDSLHLHLSYLRGQWAVPETEVFVQALFEDLMHEYGVRDSLSIVLSDVYMFEETDLALYLAERTGRRVGLGKTTPTLFLPVIESANPLQWSTLVHEMAHALPAPPVISGEDLQQLTGGDARGEEMVKNWIQEIFCDLVSLHLLGPAYIASFTDFVVAVGSEKILEAASASHPSPRFRICLMRDVLERAGIVARFTDERLAAYEDLALLYYNLFEERSRAERQHFSPPLQPKNFPIDIRYFWERIEEKINEMIPASQRVQKFEQGKLKYLLARLKSKVPISSYSPVEIREGKTTGKKALDALDEALSGERRVSKEEVEAGLQGARRAVEEEACTIAEIINAGWIFKCQDVYGPLLESFEDFESKLIYLREEIFSLDRILRNSVETSHLQRLISSPFE